MPSHFFCTSRQLASKSMPRYFLTRAEAAISSSACPRVNTICARPPGGISSTVCKAAHGSNPAPDRLDNGSPRNSAKGRARSPLRPRNSARSQVNDDCRPSRSAKAIRPANSDIQVLRASKAPVLRSGKGLDMLGSGTARGAQHPFRVEGDVQIAGPRGNVLDDQPGHLDGIVPRDPLQQLQPDPVGGMQVPGIAMPMDGHVRAPFLADGQRGGSPDFAAFAIAYVRGFTRGIG